jgi:hypothetical protein
LERLQGFKAPVPWTIRAASYATPKLVEIPQLERFICRFAELLGPVEVHLVPFNITEKRPCCLSGSPRYQSLRHSTSTRQTSSLKKAFNSICGEVPQPPATFTVEPVHFYLGLVAPAVLSVGKRSYIGENRLMRTRYEVAVDAL